MSAHPYTWLTVALYMVAGATGGAFGLWVFGGPVLFGAVVGCVIGFYDGYELLINQEPPGQTPVEGRENDNGR